jgi:endogenous inhibitor of DNA gyrase (YacG/DUF329 family)
MPIWLCPSRSWTYFGWTLAQQLPEPHARTDGYHVERLSELGRALAAARKVVGPIQCAECAREVIATTAGRFKRRYCSSVCQQRAYRRAHAGEYNARQRERRAQRRVAPSEAPCAS